MPDMIVESFSDGDKYYHHKSCFDLQEANEYNQAFKLGPVVYEAVDIEKFRNNNDEILASCFECLEEVRD